MRTLRIECGASLPFPITSVTAAVILAATARMPVMDAMTLRGSMLRDGGEHSEALSVGLWRITALLHVGVCGRHSVGLMQDGVEDLILIGWVLSKRYISGIF